MIRTYGRSCVGGHLYEYLLLLDLCLGELFNSYQQVVAQMAELQTPKMRDQNGCDAAK
jgi:hypothetical protein